MNNNQAKQIATLVLSALMAPEDIRKLPYMQALLLCGLPGSGKSTIARLLEEGYGFERLSTDQIRTQELFTHQEHRLAKEHAQVMQSRFVVYEELAKRAQKMVLQGRRVVIDGTNMDDKRLTVLGGISAAIPTSRIGVILIKPPEWIMRRRFELEGEEAKHKWLSVYTFWRKHMKQGEAAYVSPVLFPQLTYIKIKRYSIKTFAWVPDIKTIIWDMDGTLYKVKGELSRRFDEACIKVFSDALKMNKNEGELEFWRRYKKFGSKTKTLDSVKLSGREIMNKISVSMDYARYLRVDKRLVSLFETLVTQQHILLTNAGREETKRKLTLLGLDPGFFRKIYVSHELAFEKPDVRIYRHVIKELGLKPKQVLVVGDREATDIIPAVKLRMHTAMVWGKSKQADVSFKNVYEVAELFGKEV